MRRTALLVALLAPVAAARSQCPDGSPPPCARAAARPVPVPADRARALLFLPFRNVTRRSEHEWLVAGAPLMLAQALGQFRDLHVVPDEQVAAARRRLRLSADSALDARQLRALAGETGGWTAVTGTIIAGGPRLRVALQAIDVPTGRTLLRAEQEVDSAADIRPTFDALSVRVLEPAGVPSRGASLAALTTRSVDAYRWYARGVGHQHASEYRDALAAFDSATRRDSTFALAWSGLALVSVSARGFQDMMDVRSPLYRATQRAAQSVDRLPPADAALVRALSLFVRAQIPQARALADSLATAQPHNLSALELSAAFHGIGAFVGRSRDELTASSNRSIDLARRVLDTDPERRMAYSMPVMINGMAGGVFWGQSWVDRRQFTSLPFMLLAVTTRPESTYVPLFRDSIVFTPADSFRALTPAGREALRRPGAERAMQWVQQWLLAGPDDADAHLWASRIAELLGDFAMARREMEIADSIGIQTGLEHVAARRMSLLLLTGDHEPAGAIADSLLRTGAMAAPPMIPNMDRRWSHGGVALLLSGRWAAAGQLSLLMGRAFPALRPCDALVQEIAVPSQLRSAVIDAVRRNVEALRGVPELAPCADTFLAAKP